MFNWILNKDLTRGVVNVGCGWNLSAWNSWLQAGVLGSGWDSIKLSETFWWYGNPTCSDSIGSNQIEKDQAHVSRRPVWEKRESLSNLCRIQQMPTWLPTWKAKSLYHVCMLFADVIFFCHFKSIKIKPKKNSFTQANSAYYIFQGISKIFSNIFALLFTFHKL